MELLKFGVLLTAFAIFAAVVLSVLVALLMMWLAGFAAWLGERKKKGKNRTGGVGRLAGQEGM